MIAALIEYVAKALSERLVLGNVCMVFSKAQLKVGWDNKKGFIFAQQ
jgi:hypothetical protein